MRRAMLVMVVVGVLVAATGVANPQAAQAAPGYFNFSIGGPGYNLGYSNAYPSAMPYGYAAPMPQAYPYAAVPYGGVGYGYPVYRPPYAAYYGGGFGGYGGYGGPSPYYGHHGHGHHHW